MENKTTPAPETLDIDTLFAGMRDALLNTPQAVAEVEWSEVTPEGQEWSKLFMAHMADADCDTATAPADMARMKELSALRDVYTAHRAPEIAREWEVQGR